LAPQAVVQPCVVRLGAKRSTDLVPNLAARRLPSGGRARLRHLRSATIKV
jgi:hypothetical protein